MFVNAWDSYTNTVIEFYTVIPNEPPMHRELHLVERIPVMLAFEVCQHKFGHNPFLYRAASFFRSSEGFSKVLVNNDGDMIVINARYHYD